MREPVTASFCAVSLVVFAASLVAPTIGEFLVLHPMLVTSHGYFWQLLTYALFPVNLLYLLVVTGLLLWFGWYLEPRLGSRRMALILGVTAVVGGLGYALLTPTPAPLAGGAFVTSGVGAVFLLWTIFNRSSLRWSHRIFWALSAYYVFLVFIASPLHLIVPNLAVWIAAVSLAWRRLEGGTA